MKELTLNIVTPRASYGPFCCDSVHLTVCDSKKGRGGGSYGIRAGHTESLLTLDKGPVEAFLSGKAVLTGKCSGGFATVEENTVLIITEDFIAAGQ